MVNKEHLTHFVIAAAATFVGVAAYMKLAPKLHKSIPYAFEGRGGGAGA